MRRLLVNDCLSVGGEVTFWNLLKEWFGMEVVGGNFSGLADLATLHASPMMDPNSTHDLEETEPWPRLIIRNASYFGPLKASERVSTISLLQDIFTEGPMREMQIDVLKSCQKVVFNSAFTAFQYRDIVWLEGPKAGKVIPLPVDFSVFEPGNPMGLQQALSLPDHCVCWVGACQGPAGHVKGWDIFQQIVRQNPDIPFVAVLKDGFPDGFPPNMRCYARIPQDELAKVIGACRVGLCTSRMESQHLAGIEMGACGLPLVVPNVGTYWNRKDWPGATVLEADIRAYTTAIRDLLMWKHATTPEEIRSYWKREFDRPVIREQWTKLIEEVESAAV